MLLTFEGNNIGPFRDDFELDMQPDRHVTNMDWCVLSEPCEKKYGYGFDTMQALPVAALYGPNASGKSSVFRALAVMRQIVCDGGIRNINLRYLPFRFRGRKAPVVFTVCFLYRGRLFEYSLSIDTGRFYDGTDHPRIIREDLDGDDVFTRVSEHDSPAIGEEDLYLTSGFRADRPESANLIVEWFRDRLFVDGSLSLNDPQHPLRREDLGLVNDWISRAAKEAGIPGNFAYVRNPMGGAYTLVSRLLNRDGSIRQEFKASVLESDGTIRLLTLIPSVMHTLQTGGVLAVDDMDRLHPELVLSILSLFRNDEINTKHAQFLFSTHNPAYLDDQTLRRDEVKLLQRDERTKVSELYQLSDFPARNNHFSLNYLAGRYGAIPSADFSGIATDAVTGSGTPGGI